MSKEWFRYAIYIFSGGLPVVLLSAYRGLSMAGGGDRQAAWSTTPLLSVRTPAERRLIYEAMGAVALGVTAAALLVVEAGIGQGQWVIWSVASVVTGGATGARHKLAARSIGALIGVPLGIGLGFLLPSSATTSAICALLALLTIEAFHSYGIGFSARCLFAAAALTVADKSIAIASERAENIIVGGIIGLASFLIVHGIAKGLIYINRQ